MCSDTLAYGHNPTGLETNKLSALLIPHLGDDMYVMLKAWKAYIKKT